MLREEFGNSIARCKSAILKFSNGKCFSGFSLFMSLNRLVVLKEVVDLAAEESKNYEGVDDGKKEDEVLGV